MTFHPRNAAGQVIADPFGTFQPGGAEGGGVSSVQSPGSAEGGNAVPAAITPSFGTAAVTASMAAQMNAFAPPAMATPGVGRDPGGRAKSAGVKARRASRASAGGSGRSVLTSGQGLLTKASTAKKTLLGV